MKQRRPSGMPWVGDLPAHWEVKPLRAVADECAQPNEGMIESNLLSLSYGRIVPKDINANDGLLPESFETYQVVEPGDIVLRLTDLQNDKRSLRSGLVKERGIITSAYTALRPTAAMPHFLSYLLRAYDVTKVFYSMGGGLRQSLKYSDLRQLPIIVPSMEEQVSTAAFLDRETAKIDALVEEQRRLIELLKEKRQAIISHAVTKGLDPTAKMKPSGVEWLGDLPAHWEVSQLRRLVQTGRPITYGIVQPGERDPNGRYMVRGQDYSQGWVDPSDVFTVSPEVEEPYRRARLEAGDLVLTIVGAGTGNVAVVPDAYDGANITQTTARIAPEQSAADGSFLAMALTSFVGRTQVQLYQKGAAQPGLNLEHLRAFYIPLPPIEEQLSIVASAGPSIERLDALSSHASAAADLLIERRSALISAAVTGKIDVCEMAPVAEAAA